MEEVGLEEEEEEEPGSTRFLSFFPPRHFLFSPPNLLCCHFRYFSLPFKRGEPASFLLLPLLLSSDTLLLLHHLVKCVWNKNPLIKCKPFQTALYFFLPSFVIFVFQWEEKSNCQSLLFFSSATLYFLPMKQAAFEKK